MRSSSRYLGVRSLALLVLLGFVPSALGVTSEDFNISSDLDKAEPLLCNVHCNCTDGREARIVCNKTTAQVHKLTEQVYDTFQKDPKKWRQIYVLVQDAAQVIVAEDFLLKWGEYKSSALDLWDIDDLVFEPRTSIAERRTRLEFGGVGIINSTVRELPRGLVINKKAASLVFYNSTVDRIPAHTLVGVDKLRYFIIDMSRIGLLQGAALSKPVVLERRPGKLRDVSLLNSTIGVIEANALQIAGYKRYWNPEKFTVSNSRIGFLEKNAFHLQGHLVIEVKDTWVVNMEAGSLSVNSTKPVKIINNTFIGQPGLLVDLPCGDSTEVEGNLVIPVESPKVMPHSHANMDTDSSKDSSVSTEQSEGEGTTAAEETEPWYALETTSIMPTEIPEPSAPVTGSLPDETGDRYFHPLCVHNFVISRDSIVEEEDIPEEKISLLESKFLVYLLAFCCITLLVLLLCMVISNRLNKKKTKKIINEDSIYEEPIFHYNHRPPPLVLCPPPIATSHAIQGRQVVTVSDEPKPSYMNACGPPPGLCRSNSLDRFSACQNQQSQSVPIGNEYCTMRPQPSKLEKTYDDCHSTLP